ncbi:MAG: hypothetical protein KDE31_16415, partial [Caldilineaceae bacterium]|nr:hypothetical protein [Caldilineaceae bacterium]
MIKQSRAILWLMTILILLLAACAPMQQGTAPAEEAAPAAEAAVTEAPAEEPTSDIGSADHPIKVFFVPSVDA